MFEKNSHPPNSPEPTGGSFGNSASYGPKGYQDPDSYKVFHHALSSMSTMSRMMTVLFVILFALPLIIFAGMMIYSQVSDEPLAGNVQRYVAQKDSPSDGDVVFSDESYDGDGSTADTLVGQWQMGSERKAIQIVRDEYSTEYQHAMALYADTNYTYCTYHVKIMDVASEASATVKHFKLELAWYYCSETGENALGDIANMNVYAVDYGNGEVFLKMDDDRFSGYWERMAAV